MKIIDYDNIICSMFKGQRVSSFGIFEYISAENISQIVINSQGYYLKSAFDSTLKCIVLSNDAYIRFTKKIFTPYQHIAYLYNHVKKFEIKIISENQVLEMCEINSPNKMVSKYLGRQIFYPLSDYIILDISSTGFDYHLDEIIKISALKIKNNIINDRFEANIKTFNDSNKYIASVARGCINPPLIRYTLEEAIIRYVNFIEDLVIITPDALIKNTLIFYLYYQATLRTMNNNYVDILQLSGNIFPNIKKISIDNVSKKLKINLNCNQTNSNELSWCEDIYKCYEVLKKKLRFKDISLFHYNMFKNKIFVLEGIFESISRQIINDILLYLGAKISKTLCKSVDYLLLSNTSYCDYANGKKTKKQILASNLMMENGKIIIISENTFKNILYYNFMNNDKDILIDNPISNNIEDLLSY